MLLYLHSPQQIVVHHFSDHLMDGYNVITEAHAASVLFVFKILYDTQALLLQQCCCMLYALA